MADLSFWELLGAINSTHPEVIPLLQKPGMFQAVADAMNAAANGTPWTPAQYDARLQQTPYYQTTDLAMRQLDVLQFSDPATFQAKAKIASDSLMRISQETGITMPGNSYWDLLRQATANQWSDADIRQHLTQYADVTHAQGELASNVEAIRAQASDYGIPVSDDALKQWATGLISGSQTTDSIKGQMIEYAKSMYPQLDAALDSGVTVKQYASPYAQIAAKELNINPSDFNLSDPKWTTALATTDPKTGQRVPMSLDQWQTKVRTDPQYGYDLTQGARDQAATLVTNLGQKLGVVA